MRCSEPARAICDKYLSQLLKKKINKIPSKRLPVPVPPIVAKSSSLQSQFLPILPTENTKKVKILMYVKTISSLRRSVSRLNKPGLFSLHAFPCPVALSPGFFPVAHASPRPPRCKRARASAAAAAPAGGNGCPRGAPGPPPPHSVRPRVCFVSRPGRRVSYIIHTI